MHAAPRAEQADSVALLLVLLLLAVLLLLLLLLALALAVLLLAVLLLAAAALLLAALLLAALLLAALLLLLAAALPLQVVLPLLPPLFPSCPPWAAARWPLAGRKQGSWAQTARRS